MMCRMTFHDLPGDIRERSLADPVLAADLLDLFGCRPAGRRLAVIMCDDDRRPLNPIVIGDFDRTNSRFGSRGHNFSGVLRDLRVPAVVVGIGKDAGLIDDWTAAGTRHCWTASTVQTSR